MRFSYAYFDKSIKCFWDNFLEKTSNSPRPDLIHTMEILEERKLQEDILYLGTGS
jgi:hypothetical protein